jgi:hypothetical protein
VIQWAPFFEDKPKKKSDIFPLNMDEIKVVKKRKAPKVSEQDLKVYEAMQFNKK